MSILLEKVSHHLSPNNEKKDKIEWIQKKIIGLIFISGSYQRVHTKELFSEEKKISEGIVLQKLKQKCLKKLVAEYVKFLYKLRFS